MTKLGTAMNKPVFSMPESSKELVLCEARVGIEIEFEGWNGLNGSTYWDNHMDESLRNNGQEFTTRGGLVGKDIVLAVDEFLALAHKHKWQEGTPRAGIHIHIDCTDLDISRGELAAFLSSYMLIEHAMFSFAGEWRRSCGFCDALEDSDADFNNISRAIFDKKGKDLRNVIERESIHKYMAVNLLSLGKFGTVEFRVLPTTFDRQRILDWINIILQLKKASKLLDIRTSLIKQFSAVGATAFVSSFMGDMWHLIEPHFNEGRAWKAIDNALALMSYAKLVVGNSAETAAEVWETSNSKPTWVGDKLAAIAKQTKKPASKGSSEVGVAPFEEPALEGEQHFGGVEMVQIQVAERASRHLQENAVVEAAPRPPARMAIRRQNPFTTAALAGRR